MNGPKNISEGVSSTEGRHFSDDDHISGIVHITPGKPITAEERMRSIEVRAIISQFPVMHCGWECDDKGWLVELMDGTKAVVLTSHGGFYIAKRDECEAKLAEYFTASNGLLSAMTEVFGPQS